MVTGSAIFARLTIVKTDRRTTLINLLSIYSLIQMGQFNVTVQS